MLKKIPLFTSLLFSALQAHAQLPPECAPGQLPADDCIDACIYCDFNNYTGMTSGYTQGSAPGFCGSIENEQWLGFIAGAGSATFTASAFNCTNGNGVQIALYSDCGDVPIPNGCNGGAMGGANNPVSINVTLTPGANYYLLIDGYGGDQCEFTITVSPPGAVQAPPIANVIGAIEGPLNLCPGATVTYTVPPVTNAGAYTWTIPAGWLVNGDPGPVTLTAPDGNTVQITAGPTLGNNFQICVQAANSCDPDGPSICRSVNVQNLPTTVIPPVTICYEDAPYILPWGADATVTGAYETTLQSIQGCDSIVSQFVTVKNPLITSLPLKTLCMGECFTVCNQEFCDAGNYQVLCESFQGCDSSISFAIQLLEPIANINGGGVLNCSTSSIALTASPSPAITIFNWKNLAGQILGNNPGYTVTSPGTYILTATMSGGGTQCAVADTIVIAGNNTPPTLTAAGGNLTCTINSIQLSTSTNAINPVWSWSGPNGFNSNSANPTVSVPGTYTVTITSGSNGCTATSSVVVTGDTSPPNLSTQGSTLTCAITSGQITVNASPAASGFLWAGPNGFNANVQTPTVTAAGTYTVTVTSSVNGCTSTATTTVALDNTPPAATATTSGIISCSSPSVTLNGGPGNAGNTFAWTGPNNFSSNQQNPGVSDAGTYTVTVTNPSNDCTATAVATVTADLNPPTASSTTGTLTCLTLSLVLNGNASLPSTYAWIGPNNFSSNQQNPSVTDPGDYTLTASAANGCTGSITVTVLQDIIPPAASATGNTIDCNNPSVSISAVAPAGISFEWTGPNNFSSTQQNPNVDAAGVYQVTVSSPNGCTSSANASVMLDLVTAVLSASAFDFLTCSAPSVNIQTTITTTSSALDSILWTGPNGFSSSIANPSVSLPGVYTLTATTLNGCTATLQTTVNQNIDPPNLTVLGGSLTCTITNLELDGGSTTPGAIFTWGGPNNFVSSLEDPNVSEAGLYTLTVTGSSNGCTASATVDVLLNIVPPDAAAISSNNLDCDDLNTTLTASSSTSGVGYVWTGPNNFSATTAVTSTAVPGDYEVAVTAPNGCVSFSTVTVSQDIINPSAEATGGTIDCISGQATLAGNTTTGASAYSWTGPNNFSSSLQNPIATEEGQYVLTVTGPNGCTASATALVLENTLSPMVTISGGGTLTCVLSELALAGSIATPGATGVWTGPNNFIAPQDSITVSLPGVYTFTVTAQNGCISAPTSTVLVNTQNPQGVSATGGLLNCNFPSIELAANSISPGVVYFWTGPGNFISNLPNPSVTNPGPYTLMVTDPQNGCTTTATALVTQDPTVPSITVAADSLTCTYPSIVLDATTNSQGLEFSWTGPNGFASILEDPTTSIPGVYQVVVTAVSSGCSATFNYTLTQNVNPPGVTAQGDTLTCTQTSGQISSSSNASDVTYVWSGPAGFSSSLPNPAVTLTGTYTVITTGANGCTSSAQVQVSPDINAPVVTATGGTVTCTISSITLNASANTVVNWQWTGPGNFSSTLQNPAITTAGNYVVAATAANGCVTSFGVTVLADTDSPEVSIETPGELDCTTTLVGLNATVAGTSPFSYQWSTTDGNIVSGANSLTPTVSQAGIYQLLVTNPLNGCTSIQVEPVLSNDDTPNAADIQNRGVTCFGDTNGSANIGAITGGTPPYVYSLDNSPFALSNVFTSLEPGTHTLVIQDVNGCEYETSFEILEPEELIVDLGPDTTIHLGEEILISLNNIVNFPDRVEQTVLTPLDLPIDSAFLPTYSLRYRVTVLDSNGCKAADDRIITVDRSRWVYIPNVFNPGSSENNLVTVFGGPDVERIKSFLIFDRWGDAVHEVRDFDKNDPGKGWDGKFRGQNVSPGVFVYYAEVLFKDGETVLYKGDITVVW